MQYGYFDDQAREYVITRPDTPAPWANYLGSPEYGALISNNAGGYSFVKSGANGRILRYVGSAEKDEYLMNNGVLAVKIGCFCGHIFRNYGFSKIEKDPK